MYKQCYEVGGYVVKFGKWHSEMRNRDFTAVSIYKGDWEVMHCGRTKHKPSQEAAEKVVELYEAVIGEVD